MTSAVNMKTIAIIGVGSGGQAATARLSLRRFKIHIYNSCKDIFEKILKKGDTEVEGQMNGFVKLHKVTPKLRETILRPDLE